MVQDAKDLVNCPQLVDRGFWVDVDHAGAGKLTYPGIPYKMSQSPVQEVTRAPLFGEHNEEILCKRLGYSKEDLTKLRQRGII